MSILDPRDWPVLVTGAGGFVGGHVARALARAGHPVRGLSRRPPPALPDDPPIDWLIGDLRDPTVRREAVRDARAVVHSAGWVSLGSDPSGEAVAINVDATRGLLEASRAAGVERFVHTSTLHTLAAGTAEHPADEDTPWNLHTVDAPYAQTKRAAERLVLDAGGVVICPGMVLGPGDVRPTSTKILLLMSRHRVAYLPGGGIPVVDTYVIAQAHARAIADGEPGRRYAVVGPYLSYRAMAGLVARVAGRPRRVVAVPDWLEAPIAALARLTDRLRRGKGDVSAAAASGGFLRLHVHGDRADAAFGLVHPPPIRSIFAALDDARRHGRAPWLRELCRPPPSSGGADSETLPPSLRGRVGWGVSRA